MMEHDITAKVTRTRVSSGDTVPLLVGCRLLRMLTVTVASVKLSEPCIQQHDNTDMNE